MQGEYLQGVRAQWGIEHSGESGAHGGEYSGAVCEPWLAAHKQGSRKRTPTTRDAHAFGSVEVSAARSRASVLDQIRSDSALMPRAAHAA